MTRFKTDYRGVYFRLAERTDGKPGKEKVYYAVFKRHGRMIETRLGRQYADDLSAAKANVVRAELISGKRSTGAEKRSKGRITLEGLFALYLQTRMRPLKTDFHRTVFGRLKPFHAVPVMDITQTEITAFTNDLSQRLRPATCQKTLKFFRTLIKLGQRHNLIASVSFHIDLPSVNNQKTEMLSIDQGERFLKALDEYPDLQSATAVKLALFSGLRASELAKLEWKEIDLEKNFLKIRDAKSGRDEVIPLNGQARHIFQSLPNVTENVFDRNVIQIRKCSRTCLRLIGISDEFRPLHGLRHAFASFLASSGKVGLFEIQKLLCHKSASTTQRYAHLADEALQRASGIMTDILGGRHE